MNAESTFNSHQFWGGGLSIEGKSETEIHFGTRRRNKKGCFQPTENLLTVNLRVQKSEKEMSSF